MKLILKTGKVVTLVPEYGPEQDLRAAELAEVPAQMSLADSMLFGIATVMVAVASVDGKALDDLIGKAVTARETLLAFRKNFTRAEWEQVQKGIDAVFPGAKGEDQGEPEISS